MLRRPLPIRPLSRSLLVAMLLGIGLSTIASVADSQTDRSQQLEFFESKVRPILVEHCQKCHGPDKQRGGLRLDSFTGFSAGGESGTTVVAGKPDESTLVRAVRFEDYEMPPTGKLPEQAIATLVEWVASGAYWPENDVAKEVGATSTHRTPGKITDEDRKWWAFQTPVAPPLPSAGAGWASNPVDHFIAAQHQLQGLAPAPDASKRALIRRVTFDLTGLPPTPAEIEAFLGDTRSDAYEQLVDRLLASQAYGERQARLWLDLVRYAESDGYRLDSARPHAWRYRDYVVRSFNDDKPYDQFLKEQLAGDELESPTYDSLVATGYLRLWPYEYNQRDVRGQWSAIINDITDVSADVFLGMGMGCARCHDHKFDPILQKDYFSFQSFFGGLGFREEPIYASEQQRVSDEAALATWNEKTAAIRAEMDALVEPIRKKEMKAAADRFPLDIQAIFAKPEAERTTGEQQLFELAYRQVTLEYDRAHEKLSADNKKKYQELQKQLAEHQALKPNPPVAMIATDLRPVAATTVIPGTREPQPIEPAFLTVLGDAPLSIAPTSKTTGRRLALANWLARTDHPLTSRVIVNRLWQQHFGRGIVATPSDFGTLGERPSHPELLDYLATQLIAQQWSLKAIHRLLVTSRTYQQASAGSEVKVSIEKDPENKWLARMPIRRLDAEQTRDAMLLVSGQLIDGTAAAGADASAPRRSIYTKQSRNSQDPLLAAFDAADGVGSCARRNVTITATQSLLLLNGEFPLKQAAAFEKRLASQASASGLERIRAAYQFAYGRLPTSAEETLAENYLGTASDDSAVSKPEQSEADRSRWVDFCHVLLNSSEFLYVD